MSIDEQIKEIDDAIFHSDMFLDLEIRNAFTQRLKLWVQKLREYGPILKEDDFDLDFLEMEARECPSFPDDPNYRELDPETLVRRKIWGEVTANYIGRYPNVQDAAKMADAAIKEFDLRVRKEEL